MNIRRTVITGAVAFALVAGGTLAGAVAFAASGTVYNGCVVGTSRTMEHVYTRTNPPACPRGSFRATWNQVGQRGPQGPSGVVTMARFDPSNGTTVTGSTWAFIGTSFAAVTGTVRETGLAESGSRSLSCGAGDSPHVLRRKPNVASFTEDSQLDRPAIAVSSCVTPARGMSKVQTLLDAPEPFNAEEAKAGRSANARMSVSTAA